MHSCNHPRSACGFPEWFLVPSGKGFSSYLVGSVRIFQERSSALGIGFSFFSSPEVGKDGSSKLLEGLLPAGNRRSYESFQFLWTHQKSVSTSTGSFLEVLGERYG